MRTLLIKACALLLLTGCTTIGGSSDTPRAVALADGVYMLPGSGGAADENNLGRIGNAGFIVGDSSVIAIDTGTSYAHGQALLAAMAITPLSPTMKPALPIRPRLFSSAAPPLPGSM